MRAIKLCLSLILLSLVSPPTLSADVDLATPEGALEAMRKIQCSNNDGEPIFYAWKGRAYSRRMGEPDKLLFGAEGMNVRQCGTVENASQGKGYRMVSRELLLYTDPRTGEPLDEWQNPWTGESVKVLHVENDPVNGPPSFPRDADGKPAMRWFGSEQDGDWWMTTTVPLFYHNVLAGDYQKQVGPAYHATEMFNFFGDIESLVDDDTTSARSMVGWVRQSDWLPWMEMQGREGIIYFHTAGKKVGGYDDLSPIMRKYIETRATKYSEPPPLDDNRPNETSWTYFRKMVPGEKLPRGGAN